MAYLTIFSAPKPFTQPHIAMIQRNAIQSWKLLGAEVEVILLGEEAGLAEAAKELGVRHFSEIKRNPEGTPLISDMIRQARTAASGEYLCLVNADIILLPGMVEAVRQVAVGGDDFLLMGRRWDLDIRSALDFQQGWPEEILSTTKTHGKLHKSKGSDYFIFHKDAIQPFPDFAIGRAGWDNWTIYFARANNMRVVDATHDITIIHQQHDYSHLPGGKIHYTLPESDENLKLAGGKRYIFTLLDANRVLVDGKILAYPLNWKKVKRECEIIPVLHSQNKAMMETFFYLTHPAKWMRHKIPWLAKWLGIKVNKNND